MISYTKKSSNNNELNGLIRMKKDFIENGYITRLKTYVTVLDFEILNAYGILEFLNQNSCDNKYKWVYNEELSIKLIEILKIQQSKIKENYNYKFRLYERLRFKYHFKSIDNISELFNFNHLN
jgi:hypothetical protein